MQKKSKKYNYKPTHTDTNQQIQMKSNRYKPTHANEVQQIQIQTNKYKYKPLDIGYWSIHYTTHAVQYRITIEQIKRKLFLIYLFLARDGYRGADPYPA